MNKPQPQRPLMLAYILFLCVCCIVHFLSDLINYDFNEWPRIVLAATIASFFFSASSLPKLNSKMMHNAHKRALEQNDLYGQICKSLKKIKNLSDEGKQIYDYSKKTQEENTKKIEYSKKEITKVDTRAFELDVLGFLAFFCIITFDGVFTYFEKTQDFYTLLAFIAVLGVDYLESTLIKKYEDQAEEAANILNELLTTLEVIEHGKT